AVDKVNPDWNEQAVKKAQDYLEYTSFSLDGLVEQLEFEGFTPEQAQYGADKAYN
ncbi:Ltp family lipoprotein, partial [Faecalibaculum rodentium]